MALLPRYTGTGFLSPDSQARWGYAAVGVTLPIMLILLFLRLYTRVRVQRKVGPDDCMLSNRQELLQSRADGFGRFGHYRCCQNLYALEHVAVATNV
jgi:hypothetical protein